jgi:hypothetical protein
MSDLTFIEDGILTPEEIIGKHNMEKNNCRISYLLNNYANRQNSMFIVESITDQTNYTLLLDLVNNKIAGSIKGSVEDAEDRINLGEENIIIVDTVSVDKNYKGKRFCYVLLDEFLKDKDARFGYLEIATNDIISANKCYDRSFLKAGFIYKGIYLKVKSKRLGKCEPNNDREYFYGKSFDLEYEFKQYMFKNMDDVNQYITVKCLENANDLLIVFELNKNTDIEVKTYFIK